LGGRFVIYYSSKGGKGFDDVTGRIKVARGKTTATPAATNISGSGVNKKKSNDARASERERWNNKAIEDTQHFFANPPHIF
jgi:hypothetical protein